MSKLNAQISEVLVTNQALSKGFADTFVFEPAEDKEMRFGKLMILVNFDTKTKKTAEISEAIASIMQNNYYRESQREPEEQFEFAVKKVNEILGDLASAGEVSWVGKMDSIVAVCADNQVFVTSVGGAKAYIIRRRQLSQLNKEISSVPLKPNPLKTYQNVVSGQAEDGDKFVFVSPKVLDYIEKAKIKETVARFTPDIAARHLHSRLISFKEKNSFAALIVGLATAPAAVPSRKPAPLAAPETKKAAAVTSDDTPRRHYATSGSALAKTSGFFKSLAGKTVATTKGKIWPWLSRSQNKSAGSRPAPQSTAARSQEPISSRQPFTFTDTRPKPWWKKMLIMLRNVIREFIRRFRKWFGHLPRTSKILFIVVVLLLIAFLISLAAVRGNQETQKKLAYYEAMTDEASGKEAEAEAAIIYGNDAKARQLLEEAKSLATEVQTSKYPNDNAAAVLKQIEDDYRRLDRVVQINDPEKIADFSALGDRVSPTDLTIANNRLVSYSSDPRSLYVYNTDTKEMKAVEVEPSGQIEALTASNKEVILATSAPALIRYDFSGDTATAASADLADNQNLRGLFYFSNSLYTLDPTNQQIQKLALTIGGFSRGSNWLKEDVDLNNGIDLAIDGFIYILNGDGTITKLLRGFRNDFTIKNLSTPLANPSHIFTDDNSSRLYILDPGNNRLVELDKEGNFTNQYLSDRFTDLRGLAINESEKKAYLLNGTEILGIKLAN